MAYTSCTASIAKNIVLNCSAPNVGGYTGRGVLVPIADDPIIAVNANNPRMLTSIAPASGKKFVAVDNVFAEPFSGSNTASGSDSGRILYTKTISFRIPRRGAAVSKDIVEPLNNAPLGFMLIAEKKDKSGDGSFEVIGYLQGLRPNADGITRDENANGGDIMVTMSCAEQFFEVTMFDTSYATTKSAFDTLLASNTITES